MSDIKIKIPNDMEQDVKDAFFEAFPPNDGVTKEDNMLERVNRFVTDVYVAYKDKQAELSIKDGATTDYEEEKNKNKDKAKEVITTK